MRIPAMQLENKVTGTIDEPLVLVATMTTLAAEEALIPTAARLDVVHANEWLEIHMSSLVPMAKVSLS
jgi:hypothetical protein